MVKKKSVDASHDLVQEMAIMLRQSGISLSDRQLNQLWSYHTLLRRYNPQLNLTRIHSFKNMVDKLYVDSILPGVLFDLPSPLLDLGTGPGMPGIPLKIAYPHLEIILSETRQKRVAFLEMVIQTLKLKKISVVGKSITRRFERPVAGVITRAIEHMEKTLERVEGCLERDGFSIFMKGPNCDEEIQAATRQFVGKYELVHNQPYQIPRTPHKRRLVVFQHKRNSLTEVKALAMEKHAVNEIASEQNAIFKELRKLLNSRGIKKQQMALVSGEKLTKEALEGFPQRCDAWISTSKQILPPADAPVHMAWHRLTPKLFQTLDVFGTGAPLLRIKIPRMSTWRPKDGFPNGISLLIPFQDPENVGAVIRSAVAFGVHKVILLTECAHPYHPKSIRASGGAVLHAPFFQGPSIKDLPADLSLLTLSPEGDDISKYPFPKGLGVLPGIEGQGLPDHLRKGAFSIPIRHEVESLNAAAATAIILYLWAQSSIGGSLAARSITLSHRSC